MTCDAACLRKGAFVVNFFHFDIFVISYWVYSRMDDSNVLRLYA